MTFVPQYFEIREVGKRIKATKKQYIWRFQIDSKDVTVELFNSKMSSKKKIMVNGQLKAEMKQKSESFMYQMTIHGKKMMLQAVNDSFDIVFDGSMFQVLWEQEKRKNAFTWENKSKRHDPFAVHDFGDKVDKVVAPTTREQGTRQAVDLQVMAREEDKKEESSEGSSAMTIKQRERKKAVLDLEKEKEQVYRDLKSSFGDSEAKELIKQFMNGRHKKRMEEINRIYGRSSAPYDNTFEKEQREKKKPRSSNTHDEEQKNGGDKAFDVGFDCFENMATYNGQAVGSNEGPAQSSSVQDPKPMQSVADNQNKPNGGQNTNFDFNFDAAPNNQPGGAAAVDLDDLLSGGQAARSGSMAAQNVNIFEFDTLNSGSSQNAAATGAAQQSQNPADVFNFNDMANAVPNSQQQAPATAESQQPKFIPNPMSHKQEQMQQQMMAQMQQQQMMQQMIAQQFQQPNQQFNTNMMYNQMPGSNPFGSVAGNAANPFMTNPAMPQQNNAFATFPQQQQYPSQQNQQFPQNR